MSRFVTRGPIPQTSSTGKRPISQVVAGTQFHTHTSQAEFRHLDYAAVVLSSIPLSTPGVLPVHRVGIEATEKTAIRDCPDIESARYA